MIKAQIEKLPNDDSLGIDTPNYSLSVLKNAFPTLEVLEDQRLVVVSVTDGIWMDFAFFEWVGSSAEEQWFSLLWHGGGTLGSLRECRHSYIGENGYVFYIKKKTFIQALDWLSKHFDLD